MPRYFSQADYNNSSSPSSHNSCLSITTQGNKSQFTTPDNTSHLPLPERKPKPITSDHNPKHSARQSSEKARSCRQFRNESIAPEHSINLTKMEEHLPDFSQGNIHDFYLPPASLPTAKELISGLSQDGTPTFSPHVKKPRASRFISASHARDNSAKVEVPTLEKIKPQLNVKKPRGSRFISASHSRDVSLAVEPVVGEVPQPFDEKKVLASLDYLERKVAALEKNRAQDEITIHQLQLENQISRTESKERKKWHRSDSALGCTDVGSERGDEMGSSQRKLTVENNRLETSVRTLQEQIRLLNRAASECEINLGNITKDRDSAVSQLGAAFFTIEQLKAENQTLRERNSMLNRSVDELIANQDNTTMNMTTREEALDRAIERRERLEAKEEAEKQQKLEEQLTKPQLDLNAEIPRKETTLESRASQSSIEDDADSTRDLTYLSVISAGEIGEIRKTLENERMARSKKRSSRCQASKTEFMVEEQASNEKTQQMTATRTSPRIEPTDRQVSKTGPLIEKASYDERSRTLEPTRKSSGNNPDQHSGDPSAMNIGSRRSKDKPEDMTSDRIVHNVTPEFAGHERQPPPTSSAEAEISYFEHLAPIFNRRVEQEGTSLRKEPEVLSKPMPAVKQTTQPAADEEDPTLRPSQPPVLALSSVIKGLEDEVSVAKRQLAQFQDLYNNQNPALARRARKSLKEKMEALLRTIDRKADYIYSLYDVVEGQKQEGQRMSDEKLESTLQSMGINMSWEGIRSDEETQRSCATNRSRDESRLVSINSPKLSLLPSSASALTSRLEKRSSLGRPLSPSNRFSGGGDGGVLEEKY